MIVGIVFCLIFTAADVFPENDSSRTDSGRASGIDQAPWFSFPYPGQWGNPTFLASAVIAMISGPVSQPNEIIGGFWLHCTAVIQSESQTSVMQCYQETPI